MSVILGIKLLLVPTLIGAVTLAGRRWGPGIAGWLSGFPIVTGPILFFITYEHGAAFGAAAASAALLGVPAIFLFNLTYSWAASKSGWPLSLASALAVYAAGVFVLVSLTPGLITTAVIVAGVLLLGARLFPRLETSAPNRARSSGNVEVLYRMLAAAALCVLVTHFASSLGPRLSGLFAMFPVISIVLASFSHHDAGPAFATRLLKGIIFGWYALVTFCLLLCWLLPFAPVPLAFLGAAVGAILVQLTTRMLMYPRKELAAGLPSAAEE